MTLLEALANYIQSLGIGTIEIDMFLNIQPDEPSNCITIIDTGGYPSDDTGVIRNPTFQMLVRDENYVDAKIKADKLYEELHQNENFNLENFYIYYSEFEDEPTPLGEDDKGRTEITINLKIERRN